MLFLDYFKPLSKEQREDFAKRANTSVGYLKQIAWGKPAGAVMCNTIERETNGVVTCEELRPDIFKKKAPTEAA